jgi:hypothetical protein
MRFAMDNDLSFRYQQHDGRNTAIAAAVSIIAVPAIALVGWPAVIGVAGMAVGYVLARTTKL